ncbi:uncharacterized protein B0H18DRAFT_1102640 [Fomitopsis serialis]|uniref:uncharacterized protein n=1 Tax=Fomitopsis serialis TaxID=139415 RepID=UPI0020075164|nr:uncharacterized protein B0H18DRAFT_1110102 [Neoantrodia serialis]XP_047896693.1 uncharacterized protein B0H18DRAFT_1102640 [Neoantrodia serialis]KAH9911510.1 hypothetical protein B0H18DRAFT_1110102 [Neoantrodia serialis]KAH9931461.1 hypothetical protein B0H18DRAFT_1102640 [Neoantrodia serialis]
MDAEEFRQFVLEVGLSMGTARTPLIKPFWDAARFIPRGMGPLENAKHTIRLGMHLRNNPTLNLDDDGPPIKDEMLEGFEKEDLRYTLHMFNKLLHYCPVLKKVLPNIKNKADFDTIAHFIDKAQRQARTDDISRLKDRVLNALAKPQRGWHCHAAARMLCPRNQRDEFDEDREKFCQSVRAINGRHIDHEDWPSLLYCETEYNPEALDWGLLKSPFLLKCWKTTFLGPSSVTTTVPGQVKKGGRQTVAKMYGVTKVDEYSILYVALIARFLLSSVLEWHADDGPFSGMGFFKNALSLFEDDEWRNDTLAWWNAQVFGTKMPGGGTTNTIVRTGPSSVAQLKQQRAARRLQARQRRGSAAGEN